MDFIAPLIRPYINLFTEANILVIIFTGLSFYQLSHSYTLARDILANWNKLIQEPLTNHKKRIAENASFYIAVPLGVFLHELGHAIFVWLFGGHVIEFAFFFFWGYVLPDRFFSDVQQFVISSAGTWMSLIYGLLIWLLLRKNQSTVLRYFALRATRFQIFFALIYYPLFTIALPIGDWRVIYDFPVTPLLSGITAVAHALLLLSHWWLDRHGRYDMIGFESAAQQEAYERQLALANDQPDNLAAQDEVVSQMLRGGALKEAQRRLVKLLKQHPNWADGHLTYALTLAGNNNQLPRTAVREMEQALALGLSDDRQKAIAHNLLGRHFVNIERYKEGQQHFTDSLAFAQNAGEAQPRLTLEAYFWRAETARRQGNWSAAVEDYRHALKLAEQQQRTDMVDHINKLLTTAPT